MKRSLKETLGGVDLLPVPPDMDERVQRARMSGPSSVEPLDQRSGPSRLTGLAAGVVGLVLTVALVLSLLPGRNGQRPGDLASAGVDVVCTERGPTLAGGPLVAGPGGVEVSVSNLASVAATVTFGDIVKEFPPGVTQATLLIPPGRVEVGCVAEGFTQGASYSTDTLTVSDPNGYWMASSFSCPGSMIGSFPDYYNPPRTGDPTELARQDFLGAEPADVFTMIEYSDPNFGVVVVEREGRRVARVIYTKLPEGQWEFAGGLECE